MVNKLMIEMIFLFSHKCNKSIRVQSFDFAYEKIDQPLFTAEDAQGTASWTKVLTNLLHRG